MTRSTDLRPALAGLFVLVAVTALGTLPAAAQAVNIDFGDGSLTGRVVQLFVMMTVLALAPGIAVMVTCFPFMVTVLSILRQAIGLQSAPPNMMIVSLAMFLTFFVMEPVLSAAWSDGLQPLLDGNLTEAQAMQRIEVPFRGFMESRLNDDVVSDLVGAMPDRQVEPGEPIPLTLLIPSFMLSEIQRAFEIGFLIFLPFLVIDLVVASVLMGMGMMMVPPAVVSLPFKLAFFVVSDGWGLLASALVRGYAA